MQVIFFLNMMKGVALLKICDWIVFHTIHKQTLVLCHIHTWYVLSEGNYTCSFCSNEHNSIDYLKYNCELMEYVIVVETNKIIIKCHLGKFKILNFLCTSHSVWYDYFNKWIYRIMLIFIYYCRIRNNGFAGNHITNQL